MTMKRQIMHMVKYRYLPFNLGKKVGGVGQWVGGWVGGGWVGGWDSVAWWLLGGQLPYSGLKRPSPVLLLTPNPGSACSILCLLQSYGKNGKAAKSAK